MACNLGDVSADSRAEKLSAYVVSMEHFFVASRRDGSSRRACRYARQPAGRILSLCLHDPAPARLEAAILCHQLAAHQELSVVQQHHQLSVNAFTSGDTSPGAGGHVKEGEDVVVRNRNQVSGGLPRRPHHLHALQPAVDMCRPTRAALQVKAPKPCTRRAVIGGSRTL